MLWLRERHRRRIRSRPFPPTWESILRSSVPMYVRLPEQDRTELRGDIQIFLAEKHFEGGDGFELTDTVRVSIAAYACLLLLRRSTAIYPGLSSIIVYPGSYVAERRAIEPNGIVTERIEARLGESSTRGVVVLAWEAVEASGDHTTACRNVVLHEFAHQLDAQDGTVEGTPILPDPSLYKAWSRILGTEYERLRREASLGRVTLLDSYGATSPGEFFAVATECFFMQPGTLRESHPQLYDVMSLYYRQDPAADWSSLGEEASS